MENFTYTKSCSNFKRFCIGAKVLIRELKSKPTVKVILIGKFPKFDKLLYGFTIKKLK